MATSLTVFVLANLIIWKGWTEVLISPRYEGGDLARLGYISGIKTIRKTYDDLNVRHMEMRDFQGGRVDMITIGDSFSVGGGAGRNRYYQDYIATGNDMKVLNIPTYKFETMVFNAMPVATLAALNNNGWLDRVKPRYVLIESVERYTIPRLVMHFDLNVHVKQEELDRYYRNASFDGPINQGVTFINEGNFKFLYYSLMYNFSEHAFRRLVVKTGLTKPMFSGKRGDTLLFHCDDIQQSPLATQQNIRIGNDNLNTLARQLRKKGITLVFMPVVDKLNLYRPYLKNDGYPKSRFFEEFRALPKEYLFIDTKAILSKAIEDGELDLFHQDDTHWSWKASQRIFSAVRFPMTPANVSVDGKL
jgi:hypothetical protein